MTEQLARFETAYPGATPGELVRRAIELDEPDLVAELSDRPGFDVNAPCEPDVPGSVSPLFTALRDDRPDLVALIARLPNASLAAAQPPYDAWSWAESSSLAALKALVAAFPEAASSADGDGVTLLHVAVADRRGPEKVAFLLDQPTVDPDARQADGTTPLYRAALAGNDDAAGRLLDRGADVNAANADNGWTVLMAAVAGGEHAALVDLLAGRPELDVNARGERGVTALHLAAQQGREHAVATLAARPDTDLNAKDELGRTALILAAAAGHLGVVRRLLDEARLDVNLVDRLRQTALHWAAIGGHLEVLDSLLRDPRTNAGITNRPDGRTARELAAGAGHRVAADLLARAPAGSDELSPGDSWEPPPPGVEPERTRPRIPEERRE